MPRPPAKGLLGKAQDHAAERLARDLRKAPVELHELLHYLEDHFCDPDLNVEKLERLGFADWRQRLRFHDALEMSIKRYLLLLKRDMAEWLLAHTDAAVTHIARVLNFSSVDNFCRDFRHWTGQSPGKFRDAARPRLAGSNRRHEQRSNVWRHLTARLALRRPAAAGPAVRSGGLCVLHHGPRGEAAARRVWELLRLETHERARQMLLREVLFAGPELFELLSRLSRREGRRNRRRGVELAELAVAAVEGSALALGDQYGDLLVLAYARLGNALRLASQIRDADRAFQRAEELWAIPEGRKEPRVAAELWDLEAALTYFEGHLDVALGLLDRSLTVAWEIDDLDRQITVLLQRAEIRRHQGKPSEMLADLDRVEELLKAEPQADQSQLLGVYQEKALAYLETEHDAEAKRYLALAHELCEELEHSTSREQLRWIGANLAARAGDLEEAERLLRLARAGFLEMGDRVTAALVALDLAALCHRQERIAEVAGLVVADVLPALEEIRERREAGVALDLLRRALAAETISVAALERARIALLQAQADPSFQIRSST